ncbi:MAG: hypothetical protein P8Z74_20510 [Acidobacteriota bacterium]
MTKLQILAASLSWSLLALPLLGAGDLSRYREFDLDSNLAEIAKQAGTNTDGATTLYERPALIQELTWQAGPNDSVKEIEFHFLGGELYRMIVHYSRYSTEGLTEQDVIEATSEIYGSALRPIGKITLSTIYGRDQAVEVIARWEDADWSFNLVQLQYEPNFTLAVVSKGLDGPARLAIDEAIKLDQQEAPQREIDQKKRDDLAKATELEEARLVNKPKFRP